MKDLLNRKVKVGDYISYALAGPSINIYIVREVFEHRVKAQNIYGTWASNSFDYRIEPRTGLRYKDVVRTWNNYSKDYDTREKTTEEKLADASKCSSLSISSRLIILDNFDVKLLENL